MDTKEKIRAMKALVKERALLSRGVTKERLQTKTEATDRQSESYQSLMNSISYRRYEARWQGRLANLAYGFLRGVPYVKMEPKAEVVMYFKHGVAKLAEVEPDVIQAWIEGAVVAPKKEEAA